MGSPLVTQRGAMPTPERQELVVVASPFFPSRLAEGYSNPTAMVVRRSTACTSAASRTW